MGKIALCVACFCLALPATSSAEDERPEGPLEGRFVMSSKNPIDPMPDEKVDRVGIEISGKAAKTIFEAMQTQEKAESCGHGLLKKAGHLECSKVLDDQGRPTGDYYCHIGVMLNNGETANAWAC